MYFQWEFDWLNLIQTWHTPVLDKVMVAVSSLGNAGIVWIVICGVLLCVKKYRRKGLLLMSSLLLDLVVCNFVLKTMVGRSRPCWLNETVKLLVENPTDFSFPSGHTMAAFAVAPIIYYANKKWGIAAYILAALIAFSRLYLYVHFPTDVLCGVVFGMGIAAFVLFIEKKNKSNDAGTK